MATEENLTPEDRRRLLVKALGMAQPSHVWTPYSEHRRRAGCQKCPAHSLFALDMASHLYIIREEL